MPDRRFCALHVLLFCEKYGPLGQCDRNHAYQHKPGDTMEVDWAGAALDIHNPVTGEVSKAYLFVAVPALQLLYLRKSVTI